MTSESKNNEMTLLRRIGKLSAVIGPDTNQRFVRIFGACGVLIVWRLILSCLLGLGDDEGYYWDWSQHLSWSYYDHPPLVGWLIALSQAIFPKAEWSVRLPFIILDLLTGWMFYRLARSRGSTTPFLSVAVLVVLIPLYSLGGFMAFPDIPMLAAWVVALLMASELEQQPEALSKWLLLGLACGLAILSKLTGLILLACVGIWALVTPQVRREFLRPRLWLGFLLTCLLVTPIVIWNLQHDFPTIRFQLWERHQGPWNLERGLTFFLAQLLLLSPYIWFSVFKALKEENRWLLSFSILPLLIFYFQPLRSNFLPHWTAPAYLAPLAVISWQWNKSLKLNLAYLVVVNFLFLLLCSFPVMPWLATRVNVADWNPRFDFTNDFYGWDKAGADVAKLAAQIQRDEGESPLLLASRYQIAGNLAFYSDLEATAYGDRANAYRFFSNSLYAHPIAKRTILFVADNRYSSGPEQIGVLKNCTKLEDRSIERWGFLARTFSIWRCASSEN